MFPASPLSLLRHGHFTDAMRLCVQLQAAIGSLVTAGDPYCGHPTSRLIVAFGGDSDQKRGLNITPSIDDTHCGRYDDYCPRFPWDEPSPSGQSSYAMLFEALSYESVPSIFQPFALLRGANCLSVAMWRFPCFNIHLQETVWDMILVKLEI